MKKSKARIALLVADAFVGLTAVGGGIALATGLEGDRFPPEYLEGTPFGSYVAPGLILAGAVGGSATVAAIATLRNKEIGGSTSVVAGTIMMGWIAGEVLVLNQPSWTWTEVSYFVLGLVMVVLGLGVRRKGWR
ncbi:MAG: hypothetical protein ACFB50_11205 [Rubrobacteraceae bacterium]